MTHPRAERMEPDSTRMSDSDDDEDDPRFEAIMRRYGEHCPPEMMQELKELHRHPRLLKRMHHYGPPEYMMEMMAIRSKMPRNESRKSSGYSSFGDESPEVGWGVVPQTQPVDDRQVRNNAGGYTYQVDDIVRMRRIVCLGIEGGTFYVTRKEYEMDNIQCVTRLLAAKRGCDVMQELVNFSGRVAKQNPLILILAICARQSEDLTTKRAAYKSLPQLCGTPTQLFMFLEYCRKIQGTGDDSTKGWGRAHRMGVANWYLNYKDNPHKLAMQVTKYKQRNGWTHRDVIRLCHPKPSSDRCPEGIALVIKYVVKGLAKVKEGCLEEVRETEMETDGLDGEQVIAGQVGTVQNGEVIAPNTTEKKPADTEMDNDSAKLEKGTTPEVKEGATLDTDKGAVQTDEEEQLSNGISATVITAIDPPEGMVVSEEKDNTDEKQEKQLNKQTKDTNENEKDKSKSKPPRKHEKPDKPTKVTHQIRKLITYLGAVEEAKSLNVHQINEACNLIQKHNLVREHLPTELLNSVPIWQALLKKMPLTAVIRNLGKMTSMQMLTGDSEDVKLIIEKLTSAENLKYAKVHPFNVLLARSTYQSGHGDRGSLSWTPNAHIVSALEDCFYKSFKYVEGTGKRICIALDISGSMEYGTIQGCNIVPYQAAAAMAMVTVRAEPNCEVVGFSRELVKLNITKEMNLDQVQAEMRRYPFGTTDCSLPMLWAQRHRKPFDAFIIYTDNETYAGSIHVTEALRRYREMSGIVDAKLIVVAMTSTGFSIADPNDRHMLDVAGFDSAVPEIMHNFILGKI